MTLDDIIARNSRAEALRRDVLAMSTGPAHEVLLSGIQVIVDRTGVLCAMFVQLRPTKAKYVRSILGHDLVAAVALWLQILGPQFSAKPTYADVSSATQLLTDLWTAIAEKSDQPFEEIVPMLIAGYVVSAGLRDAYGGRPLLEAVDRDLTCVTQSQVFASLRCCASLRELVDEVRRQLGIAARATR